MVLYLAVAVLLAVAWTAAMVQAVQDPRTRYGWLCVACLIAAFWLLPELAALGRMFTAR